MHCIAHARLYRWKYRILDGVLEKIAILGVRFCWLSPRPREHTFLATALPLRSTLYMTYFHNHRDTLHCVSFIDTSA
jgi:hypothetical protein